LASWARRITPTRERIETIPLLRPLAQRPALWRATRRSIPRAVAIGFFISIVAVIPGIHMIAAALLCVPLRANIPVAVAATFISNPATLPLIVAAALVTGNHFGFHADMATLHALRHDGASLGQWAHWLASDAAPALLTGLIVIGAATATVGYAVTAFAWRLRIARKRQARLRARLSGPLPQAAE
jgi:uncharacterized protein (DUF2062 family)